MLRWHAKIICGVLMFVAMPICFLLPVKMADVVTKHGARGQLCLDLLTCFAGGVFLSSYLVFMAPAVRVLIETNVMKPNGIVYPLPDMLIGLGFFVMLALDKLVNLVNSRTRKKSDNTSNGDAVYVRSRESGSSQFRTSQSGARLVDAEDPMELQNGTVVDDCVTRYSPGSTTSIRHVGVPNGGASGTLSRTQSMVDVATNSPESTVRSIVMMMALSIDSILEGMTIGLKETVIEVWAIFIGIIVHESVIAFCLGLQLVRVNPNRLRPVILACIVYTLMNPIGVLIATTVYETMANDPGVEIANGVLQALTSGCFIYVIFYEILQGQITQNTPASKILAIFVGYVFLSAFAAIPGSFPHTAKDNGCNYYNTDNDTHAQ